MIVQFNKVNLNESFTVNGKKWTKISSISAQLNNSLIVKSFPKFTLVQTVPFKIEAHDNNIAWDTGVPDILSLRKNIFG